MGSWRTQPFQYYVGNPSWTEDTRYNSSGLEESLMPACPGRQATACFKSAMKLMKLDRHSGYFIGTGRLLGSGCNTGQRVARIYKDTRRPWYPARWLQQTAPTFSGTQVVRLKDGSIHHARFNCIPPVLETVRILIHSVQTKAHCRH